MQKEIDDIEDNLFGSSKITSILDQEMAMYEEKIENLEKEKARLRMKTQEMKNKLGSRLDNPLTHQIALYKATIQGGRSLEEQIHYLTRMIRQTEDIIANNSIFLQGLNLVVEDIFQILHNRL